MNYIVLDLEWNLPLNPSRMVTSPSCMEMEIIQIGAVKLDEEMNILDSFSYVIHPLHYRRLHWSVAKVVHITDDELRTGPTFPSVIRKFRSWCGSDFALVTWGDSDIPVLASNLEQYRIGASWLYPNYDAQIIYDDQIAKQNRQHTLASALENLNETLEDAHDALNDAIGTATVCRHLNMKAGIQSYNELTVRYGKCVQPLTKTRVYPSTEDALKDPAFIGFRCPACGEPVQCKELLPKSPSRYLGICKCSNEHSWFMQIYLRSQNFPKPICSRLVYALTDSKLNSYHKAEEYRAKLLEQAKARQAETEGINAPAAEDPR